MSEFIKESFILQNKTAEELYEKVKELPIIDYHCHLNPEEIAINKKFRSITEIWLGGDHYKWRAMRTFGINEKYITGDASDFEKFEKWAETVENCIGNPLYHWTHLELKRYFNFDGVLSKKNSKEVYDHCNEILNSPNFDVSTILNKFNVEALCTTDDPIDNLEHHIAIKSNNKCKTTVLPTFRPSNAMNIDNKNFVAYINKLAEVSGVDIKNYSDIITALYKRIDFFHENGCRLSDHALDPLVHLDYTKEDLDLIVPKALKGDLLTEVEVKKYKTAILFDLSTKYCDLGWTSQLHIGTLRNNNTLMFNKIGADTGFDCMDDSSIARPLVATLDSLGKISKLPKTIIYSLNPTHNEVIGTIIGCFQENTEEIKAKVQFGSGWWFNDQKDGMERQMIALSNMGLLSCFVGMLTDSRSFLSYTRHEYFRRILCNLLGNLVENGEYPKDMEKLTEIVQNICYYNAKNYFNFK